MISCLLLCAGQSSRFGSPKALALIQGQTVISRLQQMLLDSCVDEIIIVTGAHAQEITPYLLNHKKIKHVYNKNYILGQTSSFQAGLDEVCPQAQGLMLLPVDYPLVTTPTINLLVDKFIQDPLKIVIPTYNGQKGHPPIFPVVLKNEFLSLDSKEGLNVVQRRHKEIIVCWPVTDPGVSQSFNTLEEFKRLENSN